MSWLGILRSPLSSDMFAITVGLPVFLYLPLLVLKELCLMFWLTSLMLLPYGSSVPVFLGVRQGTLPMSGLLAYVVSGCKLLFSVLLGALDC